MEKDKELKILFQKVENEFRKKLKNKDLTS